MFSATHIIEHLPVTSSLFYKAVNLADITSMEATEPMTTQAMLQLITYKWPMADIKILAGCRTIIEKIAKILDRLRCSARPRTCTMDTGADEAQSQIVERFSLGERFHFLVLDFKHYVGISWSTCRSMDSSASPMDKEILFEQRPTISLKLELW